jgi:hypothetical protein
MKRSIFLAILMTALFFPPAGIEALRAGAQIPPNPAAQSGSPITLDNLAPYYFDLLDFMRSQSLGRNFITPPMERQRVSTLVSTHWRQLDASLQTTLLSMAEMGRTVKGRYEVMQGPERQPTLAEWKKIVLSPLWYYAPIPATTPYSNSGFSFSFPSSWQYAEGQSYLFAGPSIRYTWEQVNAVETSPPGMLMAAFANDAHGTSYLEVARIAAGRYVNGLSELCAFGSEAGAVVVLNGKFPGQNEEKFFWLAIIPCGDLLVLARMGGPVVQADSLIPAFYTILNTVSWNSGSGAYTPGETSRAFDTAWGRVSTAIVSNIWAK